jgi:hypothetical protein
MATTTTNLVCSVSLPSRRDRRLRQTAHASGAASSHTIAAGLLTCGNTSHERARTRKGRPGRPRSLPRRSVGESCRVYVGGTGGWTDALVRPSSADRDVDGAWLVGEGAMSRDGDNQCEIISNLVPELVPGDRSRSGFPVVAPRSRFLSARARFSAPFVPVL